MSIPTLAALDTLLAVTASANAADALQAEADRRLAWRHEESEYLLLSSLRDAADPHPEVPGVRAG